MIGESVEERHAGEPGKSEIFGAFKLQGGRENAQGTFLSSLPR